MRSGETQVDGRSLVTTVFWLNNYVRNHKIAYVLSDNIGSDESQFKTVIGNRILSTFVISVIISWDSKNDETKSWLAG